MVVRLMLTAAAGLIAGAMLMDGRSGRAQRTEPPGRPMPHTRPEPAAAHDPVHEQNRSGWRSFLRRLADRARDALGAFGDWLVAHGKQLVRAILPWFQPQLAKAGAAGAVASGVLTVYAA